MKKFALAVIAFSAVTLNAQGPQSDTVGQSVPGELLVQFKAGAAPADKARAFGRINATMTGNGSVDDVYGWDFDGNNNTVFDGTGDNHGTNVAGTIGGVGGNGKGVAGVCWSVELLSAKFLGRNAVKAVDYFTGLKIRHNLNLAATNPGAAASTIKAGILSSAVPTTSLTNRCVTGGRLNVGGY